MRLAANAIVRKASTKASDFLLTGLIYDSAGNRMTPSHSRKKGVRCRYYVSQAVLQSRKAEAGQVFRVPPRKSRLSSKALSGFGL